MISYQKNGEPAVLNFNVPEPTSYRGRNLIQLNYPSFYFKDIKGAPPEKVDTTTIDKLVSADELIKKLKIRPSGLKRTSVAPNVASTELQLIKIKEDLKSGKVPVVVNTVNGKTTVKTAPDPTKIKPALYIVETYKLSNFLGNYGAGKVINTFSLLPGEKTKISIKSYKSSTEKTSNANSIFDSYTESTEDEFEESVQTENTDKQMEEETFNYHVEAKAEANWAWGKAEVAGGVSGSTNASRETFSKNMSSATNKHANKASAQRDIQINTSSETTVTSGEESVIERVIENINVSRTLNFVFRQMNQEFISILHLVDIKIGYYNGYPDTKMEVPLYELNKLLDYCLIKKEYVQQIQNDIINALQNIYDYNGVLHNDFILEKKYKELNRPDSRYYMINRKKSDVFKPNNIQVEGIILSAEVNTLRTDGIIVESLLGVSDALDQYSLNLQLEKVKEKQLQNQLLQSQIDEKKLFVDIIKNSNKAQAEIAALIHGSTEKKE